MTPHRSTLAKLALLTTLAALPSACSSSSSSTGPATLTLTSASIPEGAAVPAPYACTDYQHLGSSPALSWSGAPTGTLAYAVTVVDTDADGFLHWALFNLPAANTSLVAGVSPSGALPDGARELMNDYMKPGYGGPCPPTGQTHHYEFAVHALSAELQATSWVAAQAELSAATLGRGTLTATFGR